MKALVFAVFFCLVACSKEQPLPVEPEPAGKTHVGSWLVEFKFEDGVAPTSATVGQRLRFHLKVSERFDHEMEIPVRIIDGYCSNLGQVERVLFDSRVSWEDTFAETIEYSYWPAEENYERVSDGVYKIKANTRGYPLSYDGTVDVDGDGSLEADAGDAANQRAPCESRLERTVLSSWGRVEFVCSRIQFVQRDSVRYKRNGKFKFNKNGKVGRVTSNWVKYTPKAPKEGETGTNRWVKIIIQPGLGYTVGNDGRNTLRIPVNE